MLRRITQNKSGTLRLLSSAIIIMVLSGCAPKKSQYRRKVFLTKTFFESPLADGPITVFVHGTKTSLISRLVHQTDHPAGIMPSTEVCTNSVLTRIGPTLNAVDPQQFPLNTFYYYTWSGKMTFAYRLQAAEKLYEVLRNHKGPVTMITHSHGCNVALNLAYWANVQQDTSFSIDRLILLAPPVQEVTKPYVYSPIFKRVYTFYSTADIMQIGDPQALYWESYLHTKPSTLIPWLSCRIFDPAPHIIQTRVLFDRQSPGHLHFLLSRFIRKLPALLDVVTKEAERCGAPNQHYIVNIPLYDLPPHIVSAAELAGRYIPRSTHYKIKRSNKSQASRTKQAARYRSLRTNGHQSDS